MSGFGHRILRRPGLVTVALVLAVSALPPGPARAVADCTDPPAVFPQDQLRPGVKGTGYTVIQGTQPEAFDVDVLGVLPDGIAPGIDFVLVKVSGRVIDETGGIAAGFSGSPVYVDRKLAGSISYGFFAADQTIGGLTPAQPIVDLFGYPRGASSPGAGALASNALASNALASSVRLSPRLREAAADASGAPSTQALATARQLPLPLGVSGVNRRAMARLSRGLARAGLPFAAYPAGSTAAPTSTAVDPLQPGDSFAAVLSYGDLTSAGIGTATAVCGSLVVAFGHPFTLEGATAMGMSGADVLTVVTDPSSLFGPFKVANLAESHGVVDQDRFAGVRGIEGAVPPTVPVTTTIANVDLGRQRTGETDVVYQPWLAWLASFHLLYNQDVVFDRIGDGTESLSWSIRGLRADGRSFRLERRNMYFSGGDVSWESIIELLLEIAVIEDNPFGEVTFTGIHAEGTMTQQHLVARVSRVLSASSLEPTMRERDVIRVRPGDDIRLRVILDLVEGGRRSVDMDVRVPAGGSRSGLLTIRGGNAESGCWWCAIWGNGAKSNAGSFNELLEKLESGEHNNDLIAELGRGKAGTKVTRVQPDVILGSQDVRVEVV